MTSPTGTAPDRYVYYPGVVYGKPGWGLDPDRGKGDRDWTFEAGFRYFLD